MKPESDALPVHTHEVLGPDGSRARALHIFCPGQQRSVELEACARCPHLCTLPEDPGVPGARITCAIPGRSPRVPTEPHAEPGSIPPFATLAEAASVGDVMGLRVICVRPEAHVMTLEAEFARARGSLLPVVDGGARLVGVLWRHDLAPPRMQETIALRIRLRAADRDTVAEQLDPDPFVLHEAAPALEALRAMTVDHARSITVVADGGIVVGTLSDIDLLAWFARARRRFFR